MSSYSTLVARIKTVIESATGIHNVHIGYRRIETPEDVRSNYMTRDNQGVDTVQAWIITRSSLGADTKRMPLREFRWVHTIVVEGYLGINFANDSEGTFQGLIENVVTTLLPYKVLAGMEYVDEPQCTIIDTKMLGPILCHHCIIRIQCLEREVVNWDNATT